MNKHVQTQHLKKKETQESSNHLLILVGLQYFGVFVFQALQDQLSMSLCWEKGQLPTEPTWIQHFDLQVHFQICKQTRLPLTHYQLSNTSSFTRLADIRNITRTIGQFSGQKSFQAGYIQEDISRFFLFVYFIRPTCLNFISPSS